jgi:hypothetical protein
MTRILRWFDALPEGIRIFSGAFATATVFYFAAFLGTWISTVLQIGGNWAVLAHAIVVTFFLTLVAMISRSLAIIRNERQRVRQERQAALMLAHSNMDRFESSLLRIIRNSRISPQTFVEQFVTSLTSLQGIVEAVYITFEAAYGRASDPDERTDFEATFMTKSYSDGEITIPAAANREARTPRSMVLRAKNQKIYENTVTAMIYRADRPTIQITENTDAEQYEEIYPRQKDRIKSSIVYPVLSDTNELLGTLVVHCNKPGFFRRTDQTYWTDMLEIFAKRIAVLKLRMDELVSYRQKVARQVDVIVPEPWF